MKKLKPCNFKGSQVSSFDCFTIYHSLSHDVITSQDSFPTRNMTHTNDGQPFLCNFKTGSINEKLGFSWLQTLTDLFLYCYEKDLMSNLHISKKLNLVTP